MSKMRIDAIEIRDADIFEILLDNFPDMIHSINDDGQIVYTNKTAERLLGYSRNELATMNIRQIYADEILEALEQGFSDLKQKGDKTVESLLKAKDGSVIPVEIRSFSIYDDEGNFLRTFSILRDIREIKELQQSLVHAGRLAAIGELASGVAHDINNPLTVILLSNEMVLKETERMDDAGKESAERISSFAKDVQKASKSIQKLSEHLRNFSRGMVEKYEPVDLAMSLSDAFFITKSKLNKIGVNVFNEVQAGKYYVLGCPNHLEQVLVNLIGNACDAMQDRPTRELRIDVNPVQRDGIDYWRCDVADTGGGVPDEISEDIFQSFFTTKKMGEGTGLGLSISRGIVRDHKGELELASVAGTGATFSVYLPKLEP
ncbi:MAG: PAS domain S-box protein [Lentisphaerae bacterium]|nr:PAS domain S-box protein [Lentisphaerota bacterium]